MPGGKITYLGETVLLYFLPQLLLEKVQIYWYFALKGSQTLGRPYIGKQFALLRDDLLNFSSEVPLGGTEKETAWDTCCF